SLVSLAVAGVGATVLIILNRCGVMRLAPYILVGIVMWAGVLKSGVHATLAGVVLAMAIPLRTAEPSEDPPLKRLEHALHPWVAFGVLPAFAFANAGVSLAGLSLDSFFEPLPLGIMLGLFLGKQLGVFGFVWVGVRLGLCHLPSGVTWLQIYGVALLSGIGFTMSLFIGTLAYEGPAYSAGIRLGVLGGSILSGVLGYLVLRLALSERRAGDVAQQGV
nr:Na+/H+ antiporter NhaA [Kiloniellales bacterium]